MGMNEMFLETQSKYGFDETVEKLEKLMTAGGWGVKAIHDLEDMMKKNDYDVLPAKVIELCKPDYAHQLLSKDDLRIYSNMMPCRISVYEKENGKTYISRMNNGVFAVQMGGTAGEVMGGAFRDAEEFVNEVSAQEQTV